MRTANTSVRSFVMSLGVLAILFILPGVGNSQTGSRNQGVGQPATNPAPRDEQRLPSIRERQFRMLEMEREAANPVTPEEQRLALEQIADDYKQIQVINNKMMSSAMRAADLNYPSISQTLSDIRKLANRLKNNLRLPNVEFDDAKDEPKPAASAAEIKSNLLSLDKSIMRFVENAIFKNPDVVNLEQAKKARRDLETIIKTSQLISKDAERLNKSSEKAP